MTKSAHNNGDEVERSSSSANAPVADLQPNDARHARRWQEWSLQELADVLGRLTTAVRIQTRKWRLRKFKKCFVADEAVKWMIFERLARGVEEAVLLGRALEDAGFIAHVTNGHTFCNAHLYYHITKAGKAASRRNTPFIHQCSTASPRRPRLIDKQPDADPTQLNQMRLRIAEMEREMTARLHGAISSYARDLEAAKDRSRRAERCLTLLLPPLTTLAFSVGGFWGILSMLGVGIAWGCVALELDWEMWMSSEGNREGRRVGEEGVGMLQNVMEPPLMRDAVRKGDELSSLSSDEDDDSEDAEEEEEEEEEGRLPESRYDGLLPVAAWPDAPLLLRPETGSKMMLQGGGGCIRAGQLTRFESPVFEGCVVVRVAGLKTSEPGQFGKKRRKLQMIVQGRFKREVKYSELRAGQQFAHPFTRVPGEWMVSAVLQVARAVSPCYVLAGPREPRPGMTGLMMGLAQSLCVSEPGSEPDPLGEPVEDTSALGPNFPATFSARKRVFSGSSWEDGVFDTRRVWTFGFWEAPLSVATFELDLGVMNLSVGQYIADQPLILAASAGGESMYSVEIWHKQFLPD